MVVLRVFMGLCMGLESAQKLLKACVRVCTGVSPGMSQH